MAKILLSAPHDRPWSKGWHLEVALRDIGQDVRMFDFRSSETPDADLLHIAEEFRPVLHVAWKGEVYQSDTIEKLSSLGIYNVLWHPDETTPEWLVKLSQVYDISCVQYWGMVEPFRKAGVRNPDWLMETMTPSCFRATPMTPEEVEKYSCEVATIGTVDRVDDYRKRLHALNRLSREGFKLKWWGRPMSFFRNSLRDWLSPAARVGGGMVWGETYVKACRSAKIIVSLPRRPDIPGGLSTAAFHVTGIGGFYLMLYKAGMEEFFELSREVAVFHDEDEMVDKVRYYLAHDAERKAIAKAGQLRTLGNYTNQHTFRRLFKMVADRGGPRIE